VHPIERLRYVARAHGASQAVMVGETAAALRSFGRDPQGLVTACRRIVDRQPSSGPLWWLAARTLTAGDPIAEAQLAADEIEDDRTPRALSDALPEDATILLLGWPELSPGGLPRRGDLQVLVCDVDGDGDDLVLRLLRADVDATDVRLTGLGAAAAEADVVVLETSAMGPGGFLAPAGSRAAAAVGRQAGHQVWLVAGVGRLLPERMFSALCDRVISADSPWDDDLELVPLDLVDRVVGPTGPANPTDALRRTDCPIAPELLKPLGQGF
jgi:hypothetical protein